MEISNNPTIQPLDLEIDPAVPPVPTAEPAAPPPRADEPLDIVLRDIQGQLERLQPKNLGRAQQLLDSAKSVSGLSPNDDVSGLTPYERAIERVGRWQDELLRSGESTHQVISLLDANSGSSREYAEKVLGQRLKALEQRTAASIEEPGVIAGVAAWQASVVGELLGLLPPEVHGQGEEIAVRAPAFFDQLIELIDRIGERYLNVNQNIVRKYSAFFDKFNSAITSRLQQWMKAVNEGKDIELDVAELKEALQALMADLDGELFKGSETDARKWCEALGLPESCLKKDADGSWSVMIDLDPLNQMLEDLDRLAVGSDGKVVLDSASFQAWQSGFNVQVDRLKNKLQEFTQKYSSANATYDNFIKVLSNHLNQFADMLKAMAHF